MQRGGGTDGQGSEGWRLRHILHPVRVFRVGKPLGPAPRGCRRPGWLWADTLGVFPSGVPGCQARGRGMEGAGFLPSSHAVFNKVHTVPPGHFHLSQSPGVQGGNPLSQWGGGDVVVGSLSDSFLLPSP